MKKNRENFYLQVINDPSKELNDSLKVRGREWIIITKIDNNAKNHFCMECMKKREGGNFQVIPFLYSPYISLSFIFCFVQWSGLEKKSFGKKTLEMMNILTLVGMRENKKEKENKAL